MGKEFFFNGTIAIASGIRADCSDRLERVIDHMTSELHIGATNKKKMDEAWEGSSVYNYVDKKILTHI